MDVGKIKNFYHRRFKGLRLKKDYPRKIVYRNVVEYAFFSEYIIGMGGMG